MTKIINYHENTIAKEKESSNPNVKSLEYKNGYFSSEKRNMGQKAKNRNLVLKEKDEWKRS